MDAITLLTGRAVAQQISRRIARDRAFAQQLLTDPAGALRAAGMPAAAMGAALRELGAEPECRGYQTILEWMILGSRSQPLSDNGNGTRRR
jgi:hypothetical protein